MSNVVTTTFVGWNASSSGSNSIGSGMQEMFSAGALSHLVVCLAILDFLFEMVMNIAVAIQVEMSSLELARAHCIMIN